MHEIHGSHGDESGTDPIDVTPAESAHAAFPGTESIESTDAPSEAEHESQVKGPSWAERRKAKRALALESGSAPAKGLGAIPWDTRVKAAVVLSFVLLVSVLIFNKTRSKGSKVTPLASIAGSNPKSDAPPAKSEGKGNDPEKPTTEPPADPAKPAVEPPVEPANPEGGLPSEPPPPVDDLSNKAAGDPATTPPSDSAKSKVDEPPLPDPTPSDVPKAESPPASATPPSAESPPKTDQSADLPPPATDLPAKPEKVDELPPPGPAGEVPPPKPAEPAPVAAPSTENPPPVDKVEPAKAEPAKEPTAALPDLTTPPPTREAQAATPSASPEIAPGEGFAIPSAGVNRSVATATRKAPDGVVQAGVATAAVAPRGESSDEGTVHIVRKGENFWTISRYHYASGRFYKALWYANRDVAKTPEDLYVGSSIRIPAVEDLNRDMIEAPRTAKAGSTTRAEAGLTQRRDLSAERTSANKETGVPIPVANASKRPLVSKPISKGPTYRSYVVRGRSETLRSVARDQLGDAELEDELYRLNVDEFEEGSRRLRPGMALRIPTDSNRR